ncbi:DNA-3-methyladenine glycosylase I [Actinosynnema mirum]|uniref:DNA-3-methyladenine glycosylase I n=1 Tax=Actinosynnema mirum (strain ATCC 29888 / DSM 43827 / JCM 3225 / NBRC 14064 / NCIMB 13271 / NRRL B-12336 / IMRU 3971 / 101) TaxID=446462 RepID=C6WKY8_ACTMD|nr:DNA-3-methyladenine glycosylase I [Actinosynnema mirum DSM 43827]AXX28105.1 DNA-3-methyladenine glycosylase [Actinosynnema pretiosum subsp. pretiosum]
MVQRCAWGDSSPDYAEYHDTEWGVELHGGTELFERMCLESFQSGLSWITILRKRENFRTAFDGFDPKLVAAYDGDDVTRLMGDAGIVRNRAKIVAAIGNAAAVLALDEPLDGLLWSFAPAGPRTRPATAADVPAITPESTAMAKALKRKGFVFLGPTTCYALMQATGMVDDHVETCFRAHQADRDPAGQKPG